MKYYKATVAAYDYLNKEGMEEGELFTEKERNTKVRYISDDKFQIVNVSNKAIKLVDGRRFENG